MQLFLLGLGMGVGGGLVPTPLHLIAVTQMTLKNWVRAVWVLIAPVSLVDAVFFLIAYFCYQLIPPHIAHYTAYAGGVALAGFGAYLLWENPRKGVKKKQYSWKLNFGSLTLATLVEASAPGTWVYWLAIAGPIIAEGRVGGYRNIVPFFLGSLIGYYGASFLSVWLMAWGAGTHKRFRRLMFLAANILLIVLGVWFITWAYFAG
jgi:putative Mn2+ efflux pump MntP